MVKIANIKVPDDMKNIYLSPMSTKDWNKESAAQGEVVEVAPGIYYAFIQADKMTSFHSSSLNARIETSDDGVNFTRLLDMDTIAIASGPGLYGAALIVEKRFVRLTWAMSGEGAFEFSCYLRPV
jgi:hypothetical protein